MKNFFNIVSSLIVLTISTISFQSFALHVEANGTKIESTILNRGVSTLANETNGVVLIMCGLVDGEMPTIETDNLRKVDLSVGSSTIITDGDKVSVFSCEE